MAADFDFMNTRQIKLVMKNGKERIIRADKIYEERRTIFVNGDEVVAQVKDGEYLSWDVTDEDE